MLSHCKTLKHILIPISLSLVLSSCKIINLHQIMNHGLEKTPVVQAPLTLQRVALILPLSGATKAIGEAFKQGFDKAREGTATEVVVFDSRKQSIHAIMDQIHEQNFDMVVGPLLKHNVEELQKNPSWLGNVNILMLNNTAEDVNLDQVCYFSLSPEQEAEQSADRIKELGYTNPLVLVPDNIYGKRIAHAFIKRWMELGGEELPISTYQRASDLRLIFVEALRLEDKNIKLKSYSRNFKPIDAVFGIGNTQQQLANIKTEIDNTLKKIPLFTTSRVNSPNNQYTYNMLMSGVQFTDIALFQDTTNLEFKNILSASRGDYSLLRVYAMGMDAWQIINNFGNFRNTLGYSQVGVTGNLVPNESCRIKLVMPWFEYGKTQS